MLSDARATVRRTKREGREVEGDITSCVHTLERVARENEKEDGISYNAGALELKRALAKLFAREREAFHGDANHVAHRWRQEQSWADLERHAQGGDWVYERRDPASELGGLRARVWHRSYVGLYELQLVRLPLSSARYDECEPFLDFFRECQRHRQGFWRKISRVERRGRVHIAGENHLLPCATIVVDPNHSR